MEERGCACGPGKLIEGLLAQLHCNPRGALPPASPAEMLRSQEGAAPCPCRDHMCNADLYFRNRLWVLDLLTDQCTTKHRAPARVSQRMLSCMDLGITADNGDMCQLRQLSCTWHPRLEAKYTPCCQSLKHSLHQRVVARLQILHPISKCWNNIPNAQSRSQWTALLHSSRMDHGSHV